MCGVVRVHVCVKLFLILCVMWSLTLVHPLVQVYTIPKTGQLSYVGHVGNFHQKVTEFLSKLPTLPANMPFVKVRPRNSAGKPCRTAPFTVNVHMCALVRMRSYAWVCACARACVCACVHACACVRVCVHACMRACLPDSARPSLPELVGRLLLAHMIKCEGAKKIIYQYSREASYDTSQILMFLTNSHHFLTTERLEPFLCVVTHHLCHLLPLPGECSEVHAKSNKDFGCACQDLLLPELFLAGRNRGVDGATMTTC